MSKGSFDPNEVRGALGLPTEPLWEHRTLYSPGTSKIVVSVVLVRDRIQYSRIYARHTSEPRYYLTPYFAGDDWSVEGPALSDCFMFFVLSRWVVGGNDSVDDYVGVGRLDLRNNEHEMWQTDRADSVGFFVSELAGASPDGRLVYAVCGFRSHEGTGAVEYWLSKLDWQAKAVTKLRKLDAVFY